MKTFVRPMTASMAAIHTATFTKSIQRFGFVLLFSLMALWIKANTYYSQDVGNANALATWGTNPDGTGTAPTNFTTAGDVFILRATSNLTTTINTWTIG